MTEYQRQIQLAKLYRQLNVLVVDDFENFRNSVRQMVKAFGVERVEIASNGEDAVERCRKDDFDVILCDYNLGSGKNGQQILEELRYNKWLKSNAVFVLITAETSKDMVMGALEYLPDNYLTKPLTKAVLQSRLDKLIEQREVLKPINTAIDENQIEKAVLLLDKEIKTGSKYITWCLRTLANLYCQLKNYEKARQIYQNVLTKRDIGWAKLGKARALIALGDCQDAVADLNQLLEENPNLIEGYDLLTDAYVKVGQYKNAQKTLEEALGISPHAILRQRRLAEVAAKNSDYASAGDSLRDALKLSHNSVYESPDNYIDLADCLSDLSEGETDDVGKKRAKEAIGAIERVAKKYKHSMDVKIQASLVESRVYRGQGDEAKANEKMERALKAAEENDVAPETQLQMAKTYFSVGEADKGYALLAEAANSIGDTDSKLLDKLDALSDEPVGIKQRVKARKLNKAGIASSEKGKYEDALDVFDEALVITPRNPALNLNAIQVLLRAKAKGHLSDIKSRCQSYLSNIGKISERHTQYPRYKFLVKKVGELS